MKVLSIDPQPEDHLPYKNAAANGRSVVERLPILRGVVDRLPGDLVALLCASDLQGMAPARWSGGALRLLGEVLAQYGEERAESGWPARGHIGILLAGDLYSAPLANVRGATGDVRAVWTAFADRFRWVAGVAGNHDLFGSDKEARRFAAEPGIYLLDGGVVDPGRDGLRVGGVGGIMGDPKKPNRRRGDDFLGALGQVLDGSPDVLVLHQGPDAPAQRRRGSPEVRELLEAQDHPAVVLCGHCYWEEPLSVLENGMQVLNVDGRALLLTAA